MTHIEDELIKIFNNLERGETFYLDGELYSDTLTFQELAGIVRRSSNDEEILKQILNFNGEIGIPIDLDWEKNYLDRIQHPKSEADNVILNQKIILKIKKNISFCNSNEVIGEFLGPVIFSENGSKIFVETYRKLRNIHNGNFHNSPSLKKAYLTDMIQELIDNNVKIDPIIIRGKWCEIDTMEDLKKAELSFN